jgi:hypothetical protein
MATIEEIRKALSLMTRAAWGEETPAIFSIPARPEHDADLILSNAIDELEALRKQNEHMRAALEEISNFQNSVDFYSMDNDTAFMLRCQIPDICQTAISYDPDLEGREIEWVVGPSDGDFPF